MFNSKETTAFGAQGLGEKDSTSREFQRLFGGVMARDRKTSLRHPFSKFPW